MGRPKKVNAATTSPLPPDNGGLVQSNEEPTAPPLSEEPASNPSPTQRFYMKTVKLGSSPGSLKIMWGSKFLPDTCSIVSHSLTASQVKTGWLTAIEFLGGVPSELNLKIVKDNTFVPDGVYLGSFSAPMVGPAMHILHVFLEEEGHE